MGVRNYGELGINLQKICSRLMANDKLINLLYYTDINPYEQPALTEEQKKKIFNDLICIVPRIGTREDSRSVIAIYIPKATAISDNKEFKAITVAINILVPLTQWIIKDSNLRPFSIMGEIQESLSNKTINGLGKIQGGDFSLASLTDEISVFQQIFHIVEYD